jgi:serine/threonine protein kinase
LVLVKTSATLHSNYEQTARLKYELVMHEKLYAADVAAEEEELQQQQQQQQAPSSSGNDGPSWSPPAHAQTNQRVGPRTVRPQVYPRLRQLSDSRVALVLADPGGATLQHLMRSQPAAANSSGTPTPLPTLGSASVASASGSTSGASGSVTSTSSVASALGPQQPQPQLLANSATPTSGRTAAQQQSQQHQGGMLPLGSMLPHLGSGSPQSSSGGGGVSLGGPLMTVSSVDSALRITMSLASKLGRMHGASLIHRALHPSTLLLNPRSLEMQFLDLSSASSLLKNRAEPDLNIHAMSCQAWLYLSPEQSGKANRLIDSRSDLYSLGALSYHLLTGRPPFQSSDPLELIHFHLARAPPPLLPKHFAQASTSSSSGAGLLLSTSSPPANNPLPPYTPAHYQHGGASGSGKEHHSQQQQGGGVPHHHPSSSASSSPQHQQSSHSFFVTLMNVVQAMVLKLLSKQAEDRYQSTSGLMHDVAFVLRIIAPVLRASEAIATYQHNHSGSSTSSGPISTSASLLSASGFGPSPPLSSMSSMSTFPLLTTLGSTSVAATAAGAGSAGSIVSSGVPPALQALRDALTSAESAASASLRGFKIGELDLYSQFRISQKLYGRTDEVKQLIASYQAVCAPASYASSSLRGAAALAAAAAAAAASGSGAYHHHSNSVSLLGGGSKSAGVGGGGGLQESVSPSSSPPSSAAAAAAAALQAQEVATPQLFLISGYSGVGQ